MDFKIYYTNIMPTFYHQTQYEMDQPPPSYGKMIATGKARVKAKVKRAMPRIRGKVAELGKAKVAEKKAQAVSLEAAAGKMEGRVKTKRVKEEKKAKAKVKAKVRRKMPRIRKKVADLGASKVREKVKVGKAIKKKMDEYAEAAGVYELHSTDRANSSIFDYLDEKYTVNGESITMVYLDELSGQVYDPSDQDVLGTFNNNVFTPNKKVLVGGTVPRPSNPMFP